MSSSHTDQKRDVAIIVNPVAGSGWGRELVERFRDRLRAAGHNCQVSVPTGSDDLPRCVSRHATGETIIVLAGGDGTVRNALPGLINRTNPLLVLPLGTENLLAKQLGLVADLDAVWDTFNNGQVSPIDAATVNGQPFLTVVGAGFDAEAVARLARERRGHISHLTYFWPLWQTFCEYHFPAVRVIVDGEQICDEPALVFVGNVPRYAIGLRILREARWDDGLLDLCIFRCAHRGQLMEHAFWTWLNWHVEHPRVTYKQVKHVRLESDEPLPIQSDGDPAGHLPAEIEIVPGAVNLLLPPERP